MRKIRTPRGKYVTVGQYITLANRNECSCEHGHIGDAAWESGPCMDELLSEQEAEHDFNQERDLMGRMPRG